MSKTDKVKHYLEQGYNCGQAIMAAFAEDYGMTTEAMMKLSFNLGGGLGFQGGICGALSSALLIYGLQFGSDQPNDELPCEVVYQLSMAHIGKFSDTFGTTQCKELLGYDISNPDDFARIMEDDLFQLKCVRFIIESVRILEHNISETKKKIQY